MRGLDREAPMEPERRTLMQTRDTVSRLAFCFVMALLLTGLVLACGYGSRPFACEISPP
jgi:hypothetical protein